MTDFSLLLQKKERFGNSHFFLLIFAHLLFTKERLSDRSFGSSFRKSDRSIAHLKEVTKKSERIIAHLKR